MSNWDDVGGNPCPGDVDELNARVTALRSVCSHGKELEQRLTHLHAGMGSASWVGEGADAMTRAVQASLPDLGKLWSSHEKAALALGSYANRLFESQKSAATALAQYADAVADRLVADAAHDAAASRRSAAKRKLIGLHAERKTLQTRRVAAVAIQQSTDWLDSRIEAVEDDIRDQNTVASTADREARAATARRNTADERARTARRQIDKLRDETEDQARNAASAILDAAGIVHSRNLLKGVWDNVMDGVDSAKNWLGEHGLEVLDYAIAVIAIVALFTPLAPIVVGIAIGLSVVSVAGHTYKYLNGDAKEADEVVWGVIGVVPFGKVLALLAKAKPAATAFTGTRNLPGLVKRAVGPVDLRTATGVVRKITAVPAPRKTVPRWLWNTTSLVVAGDESHKLYEMAKAVIDTGRIVYDGVNAVIEVVDLRTDPGPASSIPVATVQLQTTGVAA